MSVPSGFPPLAARHTHGADEPHLRVRVVVIDVRTARGTSEKFPDRIPVVDAKTWRSRNYDGFV